MKMKIKMQDARPDDDVKYIQPNQVQIKIRVIEGDKIMPRIYIGN